MALLTALALAMITWLWRPILHANDIWWHLASGRYMVWNLTLPRMDVFSSTALGQPWINHEWLFQIAAYLAFLCGGIQGIITLKILLILGALGFVHLRLRASGVSTFVQWGILSCAFWASRYAWNERADLVSVLFISALVTSLEAGQLGGLKDKPLRLWPFLFCLWANMHGGFILGLATASAFTAGVMLENRQWKSSLAIWLCLCYLATLINPWGYGLHRSTLEGVRLLQSGFIQEWMRTPWSPLEFFWLCLCTYWIGTIVLVWRKRRASLPTLFVALLLSWSAIRYVRNVPYFMLGAFPAAALWIKAYQPRRATTLALACTFLFALGSAVHMKGGIDLRGQPVKACAFISSTNFPGRFFNDYPFGGYWIWHFGTTRPVFIDGRLHTVKGYADLYQRIQSTQSGPPEVWQTFLESYGVDAAMVANPDKPRYPAVFDLYFPRKTWALVYWDDVAMIFLKRKATYNPWIQRFERQHFQ